MLSGFSFPRRQLAASMLYVFAVTLFGLLVDAAPAAAQTSFSFVPYQSVVGVDIPDSGSSLTYPIAIDVSGVSGTINRVAVVLDGLTHPRADDLDVLLVSPSGDSVLLLSDVSGSPTDISLVLADGPPPVSSPILPGFWAPTNLGGGDTFPVPAPTGPYSASLSAFRDEDPNGTWHLYVIDDMPGAGGSISGITLLIEPEFKTNEIALVPPSGTTGTTDSVVRVRGLRTPVTSVDVSVHIIHPNVSDLSLSLIGPDGTTVLLAANVGGGGDDYGQFCDNATTFSSTSVAAPIAAGAAPFLGTFAPVQSLAAFRGKNGDAANGHWTLRIEDSAGGNAGGLLCWSLAFETEAQILAPVGLTATSVVGNQLSLLWQSPTFSPHDGYVLEGGIHPGETLAQLPVGSVPGVTLSVPTGTFYIRLRAKEGSELGPPSNEIRIFVNTPAPPSPPKGLRLTRNGTSLDLSWTNTYMGGAPTQFALDVTGSAVGTIPLPPGESASFVGVPVGNYSIQLRALNASGSSAATRPVAVAVSSIGCGAPPQAPVRFVASMAGRTIHLRWEQPDLGGAATSYALIVTGTFVGSLPVMQPQVSGTVGPGTYNIRVVALNQCGSSAPSAVRTVIVQ